MTYKTKPILILSLLLILSFTSYSQSIPEDSLYLGQTPPGQTPKIFAPGLLESPGDHTGGRIAISPDGKEIYYTDVTNGWGLPNTSTRIKYYRFSNNRWNGPFLLFENYYAPTLSVDGTTLFFTTGTDVWYSHKNDTVWGTPALYLSGDLYYFQVTNSGNVYVGNSNSIGGCGNYDVCQMDTTGHRVSIKSLGPPVNTSNNDAEFFVAKDESFMITSKNESANNRDLYLSYRKSDNTWTSPKALITSMNDSLAFRWGPYVTLDNKYLFYTRGTSSKTTYTYWVRFDRLLDSLRYTDFPPYAKWHIASQKAVKGELFNFTVPDSIFYDEDHDSLTYSATLNNGNPLPGWLSFNPVTRTFSGTPLSITPTFNPLSIEVLASDPSHASGSCVFSLSVVNPTGVEKNKNQIPKESQLFQNYPNPFNPSTIINYYLAKPSFVKLTIYNLLGQKIQILRNIFQTAGEYSVVWNRMDDGNKQVSSGVYFYQLQADNLIMQKKMIYEK